MSRRQRRDARIRAARRGPPDPHAAYLQFRRREAVSCQLALHPLILSRRRPFGYAILEVAFANLAAANRFAGRVLP